MESGRIRVDADPRLSVIIRTDVDPALAQTPTYILRNVQRWLVGRVAAANAKKDVADIARWKESFKKLEEELDARAA